MDKTILTTSSVLAVALAASIASPADAAVAQYSGSPVRHDARPVTGIAVDHLGNLMVAGVNSDEALARAYGLSREEAELTLADVNVGKCTVTNNCACGNQAGFA